MTVLPTVATARMFPLGVSTSMWRTRPACRFFYARIPSGQLPMAGVRVIENPQGKYPDLTTSGASSRHQARSSSRSSGARNANVEAVMTARRRRRRDTATPFAPELLPVMEIRTRRGAVFLRCRSELAFALLDLDAALAVMSFELLDVPSLEVQERLTPPLRIAMRAARRCWVAFGGGEAGR